MCSTVTWGLFSACAACQNGTAISCVTPPCLCCVSDHPTTGADGTSGHTIARAWLPQGVKQPSPKRSRHSWYIRSSRLSPTIPNQVGAPRWASLNVGVRGIPSSLGRSFLNGSSAGGRPMEWNRGPGGCRYGRCRLRYSRFESQG